MFGPLPDGAWESFTLDDYRITHTDVHNVAVIGLCPLDGTLHLAFDHHGHRLHYRRSRPGVVSEPSRVAWSADLIGPTQDYLAPGTPETQVTYPMAVTAPGGQLTLLWRRGSSGDGDWHLSEYDPGAGGWQRLGMLFTRAGRYQTSDRRCAYPNPLRYDARGRLHITWCWREPGPLTANHDLGYAWSDDRGRTWHSQAGSLIARAEPTDGWREWRTLWQSTEWYVGEPLLDQPLWQREGVLSIYCQAKPAQPGAPSALRVLSWRTE